MVADQEVGGSIPSGHTRFGRDAASGGFPPGAVPFAPSAAEGATIDDLLFVTSNRGKVREVEATLGRPVGQLAIDLPEIQALDVAEVARAKAEAAYAHAGWPVFVEDTGLAIDGLNGLPGALVRWFLATIGPAGICDLLRVGADRSATARTVIALRDRDGVRLFAGETRGAIALVPTGTGGFGWDAVFRPDGSPRTFAEMDADERARFSMRRRAFEALADDAPLAPR